MNEPKQKPGRSRQDYRTCPRFLSAIEHQFGRIDFDLAARADNTVAVSYYGPDTDSLKQDWALPGVRNAWLNPPYECIEPWAAKLARCRMLPRWTLMLVPASVDARWYREHVMDKAMVWAIPRIQFVDAPSSYPKALVLIGAGYGVRGQGYWDWRQYELKAAE